MIIQCEQCRTKFKLDDSKVPDKGVKVRCAKCRNVFSVFREQQTDMESQADFGSMLDASVPYKQDADEVASGFAFPDDASAIEFEDAAPAAAAAFVQPDQEVLFAAADSIAEQEVTPADDDSMFPPVQIETPNSINEIDFGAFAFGDEDNDTAPAVSPALDFGDTPTLQSPSAVSKNADFGGLDFSGDDMFGEVVPSAPEESPEAISFDFGMDDFSASMGAHTGAAGHKSTFTMTDSPSDTPFSLDEIDFGDELTSVGVQHVSPEELKPSQELLFAPLAEAQAKPVASADSDSLRKNAAAKDELPPLSIASRRKQSPFFTGLIVLFGLIIAGIVAFYGYSLSVGNKTKVAQETERIAISKVDAMFVKNKLVGDLLVISGEAVNEFSKPRAAIQIKGMVYGANGEVLSSKNAFCGNPLTEEQLSTMPLEKIEAAMANQFGDSLANMEVAPGVSIPFVIVIAKPPTGAKDYGVEPAGSTVATGKQQ